MDELKNSEFFEELEVALEAAEEAGTIIKKYGSNREKMESSRKEYGDAVTEADIRSQEAIVEKISENFPDDGFLGEENHLTPEGESRVWIIDPVDGTFNFEKGLPYFCVSIALEVDGEIVLGVVHSPESSLGKTYIALKQGGSFAFETGETLEDGNRISVNNHDSIGESLFSATIHEIYEGEFDREIAVMKNLAREGAVQRQLGSCALETCLVAAGELSFLINPVIKKWDYAAGKIIVEEAGGEVRVRDSCFPDSTELIASNGELQKEVEKVVGDSFQ